MINEVCFKIDSKNLYIDEYLVELNIPIFFICKDDANKKYAVMCENTSTLEYLICSVSINSLIKMLKNELTLYDFIKQSTFKWIIKSGETFESDIIELVTNLPDDYYPKKNEYLALENEKICNYIKRIEKESQSEIAYEIYSFELSKMFLETIAKFPTVVNESNKLYKIPRNSEKQKIPLKIALAGGVV